MKYTQTASILALLALTSVGLAQDSVKRRQVPSVANDVVTMTECAIAFEKVETVLFRLAGVSPTLPKMAIGGAPARRTDIVARMDRVFELLRPKFKFTPKRIKFDARLIALPPTHPLRAATEKLVKWGCLSKTGPLVTSKLEAVKLDEFGDALGLFIMRLADVTHRTDARYSPYLGAGDQ